jgi:hypothetical protein
MASVSSLLSRPRAKHEKARDLGRSRLWNGCGASKCFHTGNVGGRQNNMLNQRVCVLPHLGLGLVR